MKNITIALFFFLIPCLFSCKSPYITQKADWFNGKIDKNITVNVFCETDKHTIAYSESLGNNLKDFFESKGLKSRVNVSSFYNEASSGDYPYRLDVIQETTSGDAGNFTITLIDNISKKNIWKARFFARFKLFGNISTVNSSAKRAAEYLIKKMKEDQLL